MRSLYREVQLSKTKVTIRCWGEIPRHKYSTVLFNFIIAFGRAIEAGAANEDEFGAAFEKLSEVIALSVVDDGTKFDADSLTFDDRMTIAAALWDLNNIGGDGIKKVMGLYQNLIKKTVEAYQEEQLAKMSRLQ